VIRLPLYLEPDPDDESLKSCFIDVLVDGHPARALLDSGAARSAVTQRPGMVPRVVDRSNGGVFGRGSADEARARIRLEFAGICLDGMDVVVTQAGSPGHGDLIGQDVLGRWCCEYRLGEAELLVDTTGSVDGVPVQIGKRGHVTFGVTWRDGTTARGVFDTGAAITVVNQDFVTRHPNLFSPRGVGHGTDADGTTVATPLVEIAPLSMLHSDFGASAGAVVDLAEVASRADPPFDLILGWPLLHQGRFVVDHRRATASHKY
jgi:predicted aspartyl protease